MSQPVSLNYQTPRAAGAVTDRTHLRTTLLVEGILSFAGNLLFIGIFFYTTNVFGWDLRRNFMLAAGQGVVYVIAALATQQLAHAVGNRNVLIWTNIALAGVCVVGIFSKSPAVLTGVILVYVPLLAFNWPVLEALVSSVPDPHEMSRRIGIYNLIWAGTGALAVAVQGTIIKFDPRGVFFLPLLIHAACVLIFLAVRGYGQTHTQVVNGHAHLEPEPRLIRQRTLALWLSRISLPATYVVIYSLSALMPLLPVMKRLDTTAQTALASVWMISRWIIFWILGATVFWHTRPRLLLLAALVMLISFLGVTVTPTWLIKGGDVSLEFGWMIFWQLLLGAALGLIYTASLYFGMVLSEASTEHAGYHEALIGAGQIAGPALGVVTQVLWPGSLIAGAAAVASIIVITTTAAAIASLRGAAKARSPNPSV